MPRRDKREADQMLLFPEEDLSGEAVAGVDEAGRGPLCGCVVAAAVMLDPAKPIEGLRDSKKLTEAQREALAPEIREKALAWGVGQATPEEIDSMNILQATFLAMRRAVAEMMKNGRAKPDLILVDGNKLPDGMPVRTAVLVKGDDREDAISAASILAKTTRDGELRELDRKYPQYGFSQHKGYGTPEHMAAVREHGLIPGVYRMSFAPISELFSEKTAEKGEEFSLLPPEEEN